MLIWGLGFLIDKVGGQACSPNDKRRGLWGTGCPPGGGYGGQAVPQEGVMGDRLSPWAGCPPNNFICI